MISSALKGKIRSGILKWFAENSRDLPWRRTRNPYAIWISEIMLQQTQVATAGPYYERFLRAFPTVRRLAEADLSSVLKMWEGLGYYSRARNLHLAARRIVDGFGGKVPDSLEALLSLPGIGRYTAGAILSIAYDKEAPILDGNVKRVLSRLFAVSGDPREKKVETRLWKLSASLVSPDHPGSFNQGLMELGAVICTPNDPVCPQCPVRRACKGAAAGNPQRYPATGMRKAIPHRIAVAAVMLRHGRVLLNHRPAHGLLGGLWEFPNWETEEGKDVKRSLKNRLKKERNLLVHVKESIGTFRQTFSHFKLTLHVYACDIVSEDGKGKWVPASDLHLFPMSRIHRKIAGIL